LAGRQILCLDHPNAGTPQADFDREASFALGRVKQAAEASFRWSPILKPSFAFQALCHKNGQVDP